MATVYRIHPGIGIARLGNSSDEFCISPERPAALPIDCDGQGNPLLSPDGMSELTVTRFKDDEGRIKRQAARFHLYVYDDESPNGRPLRLGERISGGGNQGVLVDVQWRVYLANKKASWYRFEQLQGEHGYAPDHPRRNADITNPEERRRLIIDPGPRMVDCTSRRNAQFDRHGGDVYAPTFPPPLTPHSIDTLGELKTDRLGRLLVLGGHGRSGSFRTEDFGQPSIETFANNNGWFDDTSDGPVTARLVMYSRDVEQVRFVDVEYPAWVIVGYPAYVPQILDMVTMDDVLYDLAVRDFAHRTDLYGEADTFDQPEQIDADDSEALAIWKAGRLVWNPSHKPWFYRDIWSILFRPDEYTYLNNVLAQSNYPHNQSGRGNFDPEKLGVPPDIDRAAAQRSEQTCVATHHSGELFVETLAPALELLGKRVGSGVATANVGNLLTKKFEDSLRKALSTFARAANGSKPAADVQHYLRGWRAKSESRSKLEAGLEASVQKAVRAVISETHSEHVQHDLLAIVADHVRKYLSGVLLEECRLKCVEANTIDPYRPFRQYLFDLVRRQGEENHFRVGTKPTGRVSGLPLMPLLAGDNPLSNTLPSKFLRLTDYQFYVLRQWSLGLFHNEAMEGWPHPNPYQPYATWTNTSGEDLDRGVMSNVLGGSFCPGGEVGWIMRNPSIYVRPYRIKADPDFSTFRQSAAQANQNRGGLPEADYSAYADAELSQDDNFERGMQPGDLTKHMALPWQSDFNECTTQSINVTYEEWNSIYPSSQGDSAMTREQRVWETMWWPAHRPLQNWEITSVTNGTPQYQWVDWTRGIPATNAGDLKMVTEWWQLGFIVTNPYLPPIVVPNPMGPDNKYITVERTDRGGESQ